MSLETIVTLGILVLRHVYICLSEQVPDYVLCAHDLRKLPVQACEMNLLHGFRINPALPKASSSIIHNYNPSILNSILPVVFDNYQVFCPPHTRRDAVIRRYSDNHQLRDAFSF